MAFDYQNLKEMSAVTTAGTTHTMYANPSGTTSYVRQIWLHVGHLGLTNFSNTTITIHSVPDSATNLGKAMNPTTQFFQKSLVTGETYVIECGVPGIVFGDQNDTLQMFHTNSTNGPASSGGGTTLQYMVMGGIET